MALSNKIVIYQILTRLFGNRNLTRKPWGTLKDNGCGKMADINAEVLGRIRRLGVSHVWYTGIIRHASCTDYTAYGVPRQNSRVVKGLAGSPYAITDYYDVDPDLAVDPLTRMREFESLLARTHKQGLGVIIDFVPNHLARQYKSIAKPDNVVDFGEADDTSKQFDVNNNFYYCPGQELNLNSVMVPYRLSFDEPYREFPAKCTGNDRFDNTPTTNDWYETVKLNYGVDYCDAGGRSYHYTPTPDTWKKMTDILLFWASKGIDGFRCDMAEMVPHQFWSYAISIVKARYPNILFIGEVYDTNQYRTYIKSGFDYLYDKVGMYDCLRGVVCGNRPASSITYQWQQTGDIADHMLYFLENHDEQRIASRFFCGDGKKAIPALIVSSMLYPNPVMIYAGQEFGEEGMDSEGFSGTDGRTSIFDYWAIESISQGFFGTSKLPAYRRELEKSYTTILNIARREKAISEGKMFDLMYVNPDSDHFFTKSEYAFLRMQGGELLLVVVNFGESDIKTSVMIPAHAFDYLGIEEQKEVTATDLLTGEATSVTLLKDYPIEMVVPAYGGRIYKIVYQMKESEQLLNFHNKEEFPPAHTAEHLLNQTMIRMFGCKRSDNAHIERKKSKMTFIVDHKPTRQEEKEIERRMNELIAEDLPVTYEYVDREHLPAGVSLDKLPTDASDTIRLVRIGDYDVCPCIGKHVRSTSQIGKFVLLGTNWDQQTHGFRIRFKVVN